MRAKLFIAIEEAGVPLVDVSHRAGIPFGTCLRARTALWGIGFSAFVAQALEVVGIILVTVAIRARMRRAVTNWSTAVSGIGTIASLCPAHNLMRIVSE
jgi:hypothetical protein